MALIKRIGLLFLGFVVLIALAGLKATSRAGAGRLAQGAPRSRSSSSPSRLAAASVDRNGVELAVSEPADDVAATPYLIKDPGRVAQRLAPLLGAPEADVLRNLVKKGTGFVYLGRQIPASRGSAITKLGVEGLQVIPTSKRSYPQGGLASQVLGNVGIEARACRAWSSVRQAAEGRDGKRGAQDALGEAIACTTSSAPRPGRDVS